METPKQRAAHARDFMACYSALCERACVPHVPRIAHDLPEGRLQLSVHRLTRPDWTCILGALRINTSLKDVVIRSAWAPLSRNLQSRSAPIAIRSAAPSSKKTPIVVAAPKASSPASTKPYSHTSELTLWLCKTLSMCLRVTHALTRIQLASLTLRVADLAELSEGMTRNTTLKALSITACHLTDECVYALVKGLRGSKSLEDLDLSNNELTNDGVKAIASALSVSG